MLDARIAALLEDIPSPFRSVLDSVWRQREKFLRWPQRSLLFMPGAVREKYHTYTEEQKAALRASGIRRDSRSNGPAIMSYLLAGGERPARETGRGWHIHHIYDGKFPLAPRNVSSHAVKDPQLFTEAAGLVAAHPIADALADEFAGFAWLLRAEAHRRFGLDPDGVL